MSKIEVLIERDGDIVGWKTICEAQEVHEAIVAWSIEHFDQASPTTFGNGDGYDHLHGTKNKITNGTSSFQGESEELNKWENLKWKYDPVKLRNEVE